MSKQEKKQIKKVNPDTHIYYYAKYTYKWGNIIEDLKQLVGLKCAINPILVTEFDIVNVLLDIVMSQMVFQTHKNLGIRAEVVNFIMELCPDRRKYYGGSDSEGLYLTIIRKCLSYLRLVNVKQIPNFGEPDYTIFTNEVKR